MKRSMTLMVLAGLVGGGCADPSAPESGDSGLTAFAAGRSEPGAVYALSNAAGGNEVMVWRRSADGTLVEGGSYATGGEGSGAGLGSQGSLVLGRGDRWLFAVNAGSDEVSVFRVHAGGLRLTDVEASGGSTPISIAVHNALVYVLNAGGSGNISGFRLASDGNLEPIAGSSRPLSGAGTGPAQISFSAGGRQLIVTEKATNRILTYAVDAQGRASGPVVHASAGATPFGFAVAGDLLLVSEAFGGAVDASATSSYRLGRDGALSTVSASIGTTETAACWAVVTRNGRFVYVTNTGSASVTGYAVGRDGSLSLLDADGVTAMTSAGPLDADVSVDSRYLYVLSVAGGAVDAFSVGADGSLVSIGSVGGLPSSAAGLAAH